MSDRRAEFTRLVEEHREEWGPRDALRIATLVVFWGWSEQEAAFGVAALNGGQLEELDLIVWEQHWSMDGL